MSTFREYVMVPADEMSRLTDEYKGRLTENMRLTEAARLAAEKHLLLDSNMPSGLKEARVKQVSRPLNRLIKKIRGGPPVAAPLPEGEEEEDETDAMVEGPTATLVRSLLKKAHRKKGATITSGNAAGDTTSSRLTTQTQTRAFTSAVLGLGGTKRSSPPFC